MVTKISITVKMLTEAIKMSEEFERVNKDCIKRSELHIVDIKPDQFHFVDDIPINTAIYEGNEIPEKTSGILFLNIFGGQIEHMWNDEEIDCDIVHYLQGMFDDQPISTIKKLGRGIVDGDRLLYLIDNRYICLWLHA